jgi:DNA (cytosine-5)-methyltransferase 1
MERQTSMTLWLHIDTKGSFEASRQRINLDQRPAPTVNTGGFSLGNRFHHWWLEDDGKRQGDDGVSDKPPYRVPCMAEIAAVPWNGYRVVSTFSGCGGSCLGYRMAGFRVLWASEFVLAAQQTYQANHPDSILDTRDIRTVRPQEILHAIGLQAGELDLLDGSPPCASFSTAGKREAGWGKVRTYSDTKQRTDDLFFEYARILQGLQPKGFVAENVSGLVKGTAKGYFLEILRALKDCGYVVEARLLDAQWLGVPQMRQRIIFQGVRKDLGMRPAFPKPLPYRYSVRDALPWIVKQGDNGGYGSGALRDANRPSPVIGTGPQTGNGRFPPSLVEAEADISRYAIGAEWEQLKPGEQSGKYLNLIRPDADLPCPTVTQTGSTRSAASVTHPTEKRKFSIAELKRICGFPDDFILTGSYAQQWERLGRAVPPVMMYHLASTIRDQVLRACAASSELT